MIVFSIVDISVRKLTFNIIQFSFESDFWYKRGLFGLSYSTKFLFQAFNSITVFVDHKAQIAILLSATLIHAFVHCRSLYVLSKITGIDPTNEGVVKDNFMVPFALFFRRVGSSYIVGKITDDVAFDRGVLR